MLCAWYLVLCTSFENLRTKYKVQSTKLKNRIVTWQALTMQARVCCLSKFYGQAKGLISSGQLSTLLHLHIHPINLVVYEESHWQE